MHARVVSKSCLAQNVHGLAVCNSAKLANEVKLTNGLLKRYNLLTV